MEKELKLEKRNVWEVWDEKTKKMAMDFSDGYKKYLDIGKTEREAVRYGEQLANRYGFKSIKEIKALKAGDKVYDINRDKSLFLARIGKNGFDNGFKMLMSHVDSPHLDFKVSPLYEDENIAFLKTH